MTDDGWDETAPIGVPPPILFKRGPGCSQNNGENNWNDGDDWNKDQPGKSNNPYRNNTGTSYRNDNSASYRNDYVKSESKSRGNFRTNRPRDNPNWRNNVRESDQCEIINVNSKFIGRIIGRGGSKINELQANSNAKIHVTKEMDGNDTIIKITGSEDAISKAKSLINALTNETPNRTSSPELRRPEPEEKKEFKIIDWKSLLKQSDEAELAEWCKYPEIVKKFYVEHPNITAMTDEEVQLFREDNNNIVVDRTFKTKDSLPIPKPCPKFIHAFHNYPEILSEIEKAGFESPTPIQSQAWPVLLSGEDLIGIAQTGTGKTLAFLLPALIHIDGQPGKRSERGGPAVLVMAPTRELALQIDKEVKKYYYRGITSVCVYGGGNRREQVKTVTQGVDIVIATPGRLNDLSEAGHLNVKTVTYVVLDEADRMLDMGFEPQIRKVMYQIRPTRQTVMTSATWPLGVRRLADSYMKDPIQIYVGSLDLAATHTVTQVVEMMPDDDDIKMQVLMEFAHNMCSDQKIIVFCGKKARADEISTELVLAGIDCQSIHGNREQSDREQALIDIADGTVKILIATDVASRGLDIDDITHVINYDFPKNIEEYVHRVGRTGRAGKSGVSISYFTKSDWAQAKDLINILEEAQQEIPQQLYDMAERHNAWKEKKASNNAGRSNTRTRWSNNEGRRY